MPARVEPPEELAKFFDCFVPFLRGERGAGEVEAALGPSRSGPVRLGFYRTLIERDVEWILRCLFPVTCAAIKHHCPGRWGAWAARYERDHPSRHYEPNAFGRQFPDFVRALATSDGGAPSYLHELSDYEWVRHAVGVAVPVDGPPSSADGAELVIRLYEYDVPRLVKDFTAGGAADVALGPVAVIVYPDPKTQMPRTRYVGQTELLAIARRAGRDTQRFDPPAIALAEQGLIECGALRPPTAAER